MLSFLIPTIDGRERQYDNLVASIYKQDSKATIVYCKDNKGISIGAKRQILLDNCKTEYFVMVDDDDAIAPDYISKVRAALLSKPDCIGYLEQVIIDGVKKVACHSNRFSDWGVGKGYDFYRTIFYKDVIKTEIAKKIGFADMRYGEDYEFSKRLKKSGLLKTEVFINEVMYYYSFKSTNPQQHAERYGIK